MKNVCSVVNSVLDIGFFSFYACFSSSKGRKKEEGKVFCESILSLTCSLVLMFCLGDIGPTAILKQKGEPVGRAKGGSNGLTTPVFEACMSVLLPSAIDPLSLLSSPTFSFHFAVVGAKKRSHLGKTFHTTNPISGNKSPQKVSSR